LKGKRVPVIDVETFDFARADIGLFSAGAEVSREVRAESPPQAGCVVIDNTSQFRYEDDIPLVVPEVNPQAIAQYKLAASSRTRTARRSRCWSR
jgi:aspartate-semialdehyde dehydrogenase